jgi:hypothetical protein
MTIEGGVVFAASYAAQSPDDSYADALAIAAPLVVAGIVAIVAGRPVPKMPRTDVDCGNCGPTGGAGRPAGSGPASTVCSARSSAR